MLQLLIFILFSLPALSVSQEPTEDALGNLRLRSSHRTVKEKTVIIPPEVSQRWKAVKLVVIDKVRGTENIHHIPIGSQVTIPSSALTIIVEAFLPDFTMEGRIIKTASNNLVNPSVLIRISENSTLVFEGWLFSKFPNREALSHPKFGFSLIGAVPVRK